MMNIGISSLVNLMINRAIKDIQWKCLRPQGDPCELSSGTTERKERLAMMIYSRVDQQFSSLTNRLQGYSFTKSTAPFLRQSQGSIVLLWSSCHGSKFFQIASSDQKFPLSKESAWAFLAFSHQVGLCHPFLWLKQPGSNNHCSSKRGKCDGTIWIFGRRLLGNFIPTRCMLTWSAGAEKKLKRGNHFQQKNMMHNIRQNIWHILLDKASLYLTGNCTAWRYVGYFTGTQDFTS